ncbi:trans-aconitate 2-methyltransferase [Trichoderma arundinaceum]|uniref:Trans-aconitate 2-methyltransferase n=1 Tax=Trichoderma arundinaceum TaxID=490622 RepID=A0A395NVU7_TRIAR|nr:trans-aconitate 2-methyltransferase [Trichoderma arundinaceum]
MTAENLPATGDAIVQGNGHHRHDEEGDDYDDISGGNDDHEDDDEDEEGEEEGVEDDDDEDATASDSNSNYSSASEDALPPIHEYDHVYHGSGRMVTPNDRCENERQGYQHELFTLCLGGALTFTKLPLEKLTPEAPHFHILDVGCGGGHWAMEMAQTNPLVDVLGIELSSANLPKEVPPNLTFEIADAAEDWPPRLYDFIHLRNLVGGGIRDWKRLIVQAFEHLKPGGQLEFTEVTPLFFGVDPDPMAETTSETSSGADDTEKPRAAVGAATIEYGAVFAEIATAQGIDFDPTPNVRPWLMELGAEGVRERSDWLPVRNWARDPLTKKKGEILHKMLDTGCNHWTLRMFGLAGWEEAKTRDLLARVMLEYENPLLRSCIKVTFISARRPAGKGSKPKCTGKAQ